MLDLAPRSDGLAARRVAGSRARQHPRVLRAARGARCSRASSTGTAPTSPSPPAGRRSTRCSLLDDVPCARLPRPRPRERVLRDLGRELVGRADTYSYGLHPIAASPWLRDLMAAALRRAGGVGVRLRRRPRRSTSPRAVARRRDTIVFYGRDVTPRRAVPLGLLALQELHRRRPEVRIVLFGDLEPDRRSVPVRAPRHRLARQLAVGVLGGDRRARAVDDQLLADPAGDARLRAAVRRPRGLQRGDRVRRRRTGRARALRPGRDRRRARAADRRRGAVAAPLSTRDARSSPDRTWDRAAEQLEAGLRTALRERERGAATWRGRPDGAEPACGQGGVVLSRSVPVDTSSARGEATRAPARPAGPGGHRRRRGRARRGRRALVLGRTRTTTELRKTLALHFGVWHRRPGRAREDRPARRPAARARARDGARAAGRRRRLLRRRHDRRGARARRAARWTDVRRALDFGCSSGRAVRVLAAAYPGGRVARRRPERRGDRAGRGSTSRTGIRSTSRRGDPPLPYDDGLVRPRRSRSRSGRTSARPRRCAGSTRCTGCSRPAATSC